MRILRKLLAAIAVIFLLSFLINVILRYAVPLTKYKQFVETQVATHTGYTLTINGNVGLSLFPTPKLILNNITLQNKKNSVTAPVFVKINEADLQIQWAPLFSRKIKLRQITLTGAMIRLSPKLALLFNGKIALNLDTHTASLSNYHATLNDLPLTGSVIASWKTQSQVTKVTFSSTTHIANGLITKTGECDIDQQSKHILINESIKIADVNLAPIFKAFNYKQPIKGLFTASATFNTNDNGAPWLNNLNGKGNFSIKNASFGQLNLMSIINQNLNLLDFSSVTGTFNLNNGVFSNNNLVMNGKHLHATGTGRIDLPHNTINYQLLLQEKLSDSFKLPVSISGDLQHPDVKVNLKKSVNNVINNILHDHKINLKNLF